jgi:hypothetical protein
MFEMRIAENSVSSLIYQEVLTLIRLTNNEGYYFYSLYPRKKHNLFIYNLL